MLGSGDTGDIGGVAEQQWRQYGLVFQTLPGQNSIVLRMLNNGVGGCGNDLAIDDIVFRSCGDTVIIQDSLNQNSLNICEGDLPFSTELNASPDFAIFETHFYQWQQSSDKINWSDIINENNSSYTTSSITTSTYYRVKVSEESINLNNDLCNSTSEIFEIDVIPFPDPPVSNGDLDLCENNSTPLTVTAPSGTSVNWYDSSSDGLLLKANSTSFSPSNSGTYYSETVYSVVNCSSISRTALSVNYHEAPIAKNENLTLCDGESIMLNANVDNKSIVTSYSWNNGSTNEQIEVSNQGIYSVEISNNGCSISKSIQVTLIDSPTIVNVYSTNQNISVKASFDEDVEYSLNGIDFQNNNTFFNVEAGLYTIHIKNSNCGKIVTAQYIHFPIPSFFTPNGDGINDFFELKGIENYSNYSVAVYNRYGKLLKQVLNRPLLWDGLFDNKPLPTDEYWYIITIEEKELSGHFSLKR